MIEAELDPFEEARAAELDAISVEPKRKRASTSPTKRTLAELRKRGWTAQVVERWNKFGAGGRGVRVDLFGVIDLVAIAPVFDGQHPRSEHGGDGPCAACATPSAIVGIQATSNNGGAHAARRAKILAEPRARLWLEAGGRLELWSWAKQGDRGKRKLWTLRVEAFTVEQWRPSTAEL